MNCAIMTAPRTTAQGEAVKRPFAAFGGVAAGSGRGCSLTPVQLRAEPCRNKNPPTIGPHIRKT